MPVQKETQSGRKATGQTAGEIIFLLNINMKALIFQYPPKNVTCKLIFVC